MPITIKQLPEEPIVSVTVTEPFYPEQDMQKMFTELVPIYAKVQGTAVLIIDTSVITNRPGSFSKMLFALAEASKGIKVSKTSGLTRPPITIYVGTGPVIDIASQAMEQEQYGGVRGHLCASFEEALALARTKLQEDTDKKPQ